MQPSFRRLLSFAFEPEYSFPDAPRRISPGEVVMMLLLITAEWATFWAITAGSVFALCTLIALIFEVRHLKSSVQSSTYQRIYEQMITIDRFFIENPSLKPYFYGSETPTTKNPIELEKVASIAEMMIDYFDSVYHQQDCMPEDTFPQFLRFMKDTCTASPVLKQFIHCRRDWYPEKFWQHLGVR